MRFFWFLMAILAAATAAVFIARGAVESPQRESGAASTPAPGPAPTGEPAAIEPVPALVVAEPEPTPEPGAESPDAGAVAPATLVVLPAPEAPPAVPTADGPGVAVAAEAEQVLDDEAPAPLTAEDLNAILGVKDELPEVPAPTVEPETRLEVRPPEDGTRTALAPALGPTTEEPSGSPASTFAGYEVVPVNRVVNEDGTLRLDDRFVLKGKGTEAEPYQLTWELLLSAQETLVPRSGKKKIPERLTMLEGTWVEIAGYVAFPLMEPEPDELLCMLNTWDGCCIGVPPTPYDAVEVRLKRPAGEQVRHATSGTLKGKFFIKPYLVGEWLVGLYVMDNADLEVREFGGFQP